MAIKFTDKGDEPEPTGKAPTPPRAAEAPLPFAKAVRPEKKRRAK